MADLSRRTMLAAASSLAATRPALAQAPQQGSIVGYQAIRGGTLKLRLFLGRRVALLIDPARSVDGPVIDRILGAFDRAWDWYSDFFGFTPQRKQHYGQRIPVAEVANQGLLYGSAGVELLPSSTTLLLNEAVRDRYNQSAFYSMGLNHWGYNAQLGKIDAFSFGFGDVNRFHAMEAAGLTGAPWDAALDFDHYRHSILIDLLDRYLADRTRNWENTLLANKGPPNPRGLGANELAGAFFHRIRRDHGRGGYRRFWRMMLDAPAAATPKECASRFIQIARAATGEDYRWMFRDQTLQLVY